MSNWWVKLYISREVYLQVHKHGVQALPGDGFGILLGQRTPRRILASLPVSSIPRGREQDLGWYAVKEYIPKAEVFAETHELTVLGAYATVEAASRTPRQYSVPGYLQHASILHYDVSHDSVLRWRKYYHNGVWLDRRDVIESIGKRICPHINQRRILSAWKKVLPKLLIPAD